jgi:hypothetical protein
MHDYWDEWVPVEDAAARMNISQQRVMQLVEQRVLKARMDGGYLLVQPIAAVR